MQISSAWLLLLYGLSTKHSSARVSLWRKLKKFGAIQLKTSAYILPDEPVHYERFQWLAKQIQDDGGEATLIRVAEIEGLPNEGVVRLFNEARAAEYKELKESMQKRLASQKKTKKGSAAAEWNRYQHRFNEIREIDYFQCPAAQDAEMVLQRFERLLKPKARIVASATLDSRKYQGRVWMTRPRPGIDRAGSAWLITRFIDPKAKFIFGMEPAKHPQALPFDMVDVDFSHHGEDCTFETLLKRFGITDKAALQMAEMIHDADLEDGKFQRHECVGIDAVLRGWAKCGLKDQELLAKGIDCFEALYRQLGK
ncbi:MAG: Chromate resistance exported protein [Pedosphaera sp.]|nr:Chromate resistance exported protein [Pedosphaera sp.]